MAELRVLIVEDDEAIADAVVYALQREGMNASVAPTLFAARAVAERADVVVLDLGLPDGSGFSLLAELRRDARGPRVIVLTSRDEELECVAALEAGADDFVGKPFSPRALCARVRAVSRRNVEAHAPAATSSGDPRVTDAPKRVAEGLAMDRERRRASYAGVALALTKMEFDLLSVLAEAPGRVRTRAQLVARVWGDDYALAERTVDSHLKALRKKLSEAGASPTLVETVRGVGFTLAEGPSSS